jgi:heme/copper-type cytochrome/quinol oxidase subunit 3
MHSSWTVSTVLALFLLVVFLIALILTLSVVTRKDCDIENDRANTIRAQLLLFLAVAMGVVVLVSQRYELSHAVKHLME